MTWSGGRRRRRGVARASGSPAILFLPPLLCCSFLFTSFSLFCAAPKMQQPPSMAADAEGKGAALRSHHGTPRRSSRAAGAARGAVEWRYGGAFELCAHARATRRRGAGRLYPARRQPTAGGSGVLPARRPWRWPGGVVSLPVRVRVLFSRADSKSVAFPF
jgi:hypothetical protein